MPNDPAYDYYGNAPGIWGRLRARWSGMPSAYRYNTVLYGLAVVALSALVLEVAFGESSPKFEVATQVVPLTTTTRPRPTSTSSTTIDPLAVTSTIPAAGSPAGGGAPIGPLTPTTRRAGSASPNPAPGGSNTTKANPPASEVPPPSNPPPSNPPPSNPGTTSPPRTNPPPTSTPTTAPPDPTITIPAEWCDRFPGRFGCP
ncbi:MAG: hypothetical protein QOD63_1505 [Actinomycetota bacterium]|nr:hypothetical protein [Actinomycetota bacterium]